MASAEKSAEDVQHQILATESANEEYARYVGKIKPAHTCSLRTVRQLELLRQFNVESQLQSDPGNYSFG